MAVYTYSQRGDNKHSINHNLRYLKVQSNHETRKSMNGTSEAVSMIQASANVSYTSALATLSCFTTPGCFPSAKCLSGAEPQKLARKKKWEEQSFCIEDLKASPDCLVYSFGIEHSTEWEEKMASLFNCEVHAFDPTMNHPTNIAPGVTFHKLGLQADGTDMAATHATEYEAIDPSLLLTLPEILKRLGQENRTIDVMMLDCEGE